MSFVHLVGTFSTHSSRLHLLSGVRGLLHLVPVFPPAELLTPTLGRPRPMKLSAAGSVIVPSAIIP